MPIAQPPSGAGPATATSPPRIPARRNRWRHAARAAARSAAAPCRSRPDRAAYQGRRGQCDESGRTRSPTARVPRARRAVRRATRSPTRSRGRIPAPRRPRRRSGRPGLRSTSAACSAAASAAASSGLTGTSASGPAAEPHQLGVGPKAAVRTVDRRQLGGDHSDRYRQPVELVTATTAVVPSAWNCDRYVPDAVPITTRRRRPPVAPEWLSPPAARSRRRVVAQRCGGRLLWHCAAPARIRTNATVMMRRPTGGRRRTSAGS